MSDPQGELSPQKGAAGAAREKAAPKKAAPESRARPAKLQARLQERERQLAELTEQCLHFLDLLHKARQKAPDVEGLEQKVAKLEELLADARRRVRNSRSVLIPGRGAGETGTLEIVIWPAQAEVVDLEAAGKLATRVPQIPVTCICPVTETGYEQSTEPPKNLQVLAADCRTAAEYWNTAMAATESAAVLFLAGGTRLEDGAMGPLQAVQDDGVALGHPALVHAGGQVTLGLEDADLFDFRRIPATTDDRGLADLEYIPPEAFFIRRDAFQSLGPFDEDLLGHLALVDYCLRARAQSYRLVGVHRSRVRVPEQMDLVTKDEGTQRDRLVLLAQHRPGEVANALTGMDLFWSLPLDEREGFLRALFMRLPGAHVQPEALAMLVKEALILVRKTVPRPLVERSLRSLQEAVESTFELGIDSPPTPDESADEDPVGAIRHRLDRLRTTFDQLRVQVETERNANKNLLEQLISQIKGERLANQQLSGQLQTDRTSNDSLRDELNAALAHKDELEISLRAELNNTRTQKRDLERELDSHRTKLQELEAHFSGELEESQAHRDALENSLLAERSLVARLSGDVEVLTAELENQRQIAEQQGGELETERQQAKETRRALEEGIRAIAEAVAHDDQRDPTQLAHRIREIRGDLASRNYWVTLLLQEIGRWRIKPFPRRLSADERHFLDTQGQDGGS